MNVKYNKQYGFGNSYITCEDIIEWTYLSLKEEANSMMNHVKRNKKIYIEENKFDLLIDLINSEDSANLIIALTIIHNTKRK